MNIVTMPVWANIAAVIAVLLFVGKYAHSLYGKYQASQEMRDKKERVNVKNIVLAIIAIAEGCFFLYKYPVEASSWLGTIDFIICAIMTIVGAVGIACQEGDAKPTEITFMCLFTTAGLVMLATLAFASLTVAAIWLASVVVLALVSMIK